MKSALIGEVCRYYADDYIIWSHNGKADRQRILKSCRPKPDLMTQRYLFVEGAESGRNAPSGSFPLRVPRVCGGTLLYAWGQI